MIRTYSLLALAALATGCAPSYLPALNDSGYPVGGPLAIAGSTTHVGVDGGRGRGFFPGESTIFARASYSYARSGALDSAAGARWRGVFGAFGYGGSYHLSAENLPELAGDYSFGGAGGLIDLNGSIPIGALRLGLGLHGGMAIAELGAYTSEVRRELGDGVGSYLVPHAAGYFFTQIDFDELRSGSLQLSWGNTGFLTAALRFDTDRIGLALSTWTLVNENRELEQRLGVGVGASVRID